MFWRVVQTLIADRTQQKGSCFMTEDSNQSSTVQELSGDESGDSVENLRTVVCRWNDFDGHVHYFDLKFKLDTSVPNKITFPTVTRQPKEKPPDAR